MSGRAGAGGEELGTHGGPREEEHQDGYSDTMCLPLLSVCPSDCHCTHLHCSPCRSQASRNIFICSRKMRQREAGSTLRLLGQAVLLNGLESWSGQDQTVGLMLFKLCFTLS